MTTALGKLDPRIRRTRQMLFDAFLRLLEEKTFDAITVQDISERSTLNRGTFYDHFADKFALLEAMMAERLSGLIAKRMEQPPKTCKDALRKTILAACDFLGETASGCQKRQKRFEQLSEAQLKSVLRDTLLSELKAHGVKDAEMKATMVTWAIAGAALDWSRRRKPSAEEFADHILPLAYAPLE